MAMTDVDDFKAINDRYGHAVGDRVLVTVAETLARCLRPDDLVARLGGDEFAILAATLTLQQAQGRFAAIVNAVADRPAGRSSRRDHAVGEHRDRGVLGRRHAGKPAGARRRGAVRGETERQGAARREGESVHSRSAEGLIRIRPVALSTVRRGAARLDGPSAA